MADIVKKIIDIGGAVKEAVQTTRTNERESKAIERVADRVYGLVHTLTVSAKPMVHHPMVDGCSSARN